MLQKTKKLNVTSHKEMTQFKIALVGDQQSGKSCFMSQYLQQTYPSYYEATLGVQTGDKYVPMKNGFAHLTIWDFSGKIDFAQLRNQFYRECQKILLFIDLSSKNSVDGVDYWFKQIKEGGGSCSITVVGSKSDNKKVNSDINGIAKSSGCNYVELSSKTRSGVDELMQKVLNQFK